MAIKRTRFKSLSPQWQALVRRMQLLNFGCIKNLHVVDGEPELGFKELEFISTYRFPGDNGPRSEAYLDDFVLPAEVVDFIETLEAMYIVVLSKVLIRHGLPVQMEILEFE